MEQTADIGYNAKKGHRKPIRRLAMTSILKQNTLCFALPLCCCYRRGRRLASSRRESWRRNDRFSPKPREDLTIIGRLRAIDGRALSARALPAAIRA